MKYTRMENTARVTRVIGISTRVIAAASMKGWYIAAF